MPRIRTSANDPLDFCQNCFPDEGWAIEEYGDVGNGPDDRGNCFVYDDDHPPYENEDYKCCKCGEQLTEYDE